jgi:glycosyltransferase involved in cell wall biosynthesis
VILAAGRLVALKGFDGLISAFSQLAKTGWDGNLLILGEGEERARLEQLVEEAGLAGRIFLPGFQTNPYPFFQASTIFVLNSWMEGLPTVLLEALALGLPVVATDCPSGPGEILENGKYGVLVPVGDPNKLAKSLGELLHDPQRLSTLRSLGIERARMYNLPEIRALFENFLIESVCTG